MSQSHHIDMDTPLITVLMSVYNGSAFVHEAIQSILGQTLENFEFIIIDDGSTDDTPKKIGAFDDPRISAITHANIGLTRSLNRGLGLARGRFVARMDADDISLPDRLRKQFAFMSENPDVGVCGSWVSTFGGKAQTTWKYPLHDAEIKSAFIFESPLAHPAVMIRRELFVDLPLSYDEAFRCAQDYDLWTRAAKHMAFANLPEVLLRYRTHDDKTGRRFAEETSSCSDRVRRRQLHALGITPTAGDEHLHRQISTCCFPKTCSFLKAAARWLERLVAANLEYGVYPEAAFRKALGRKWYVLCVMSSDLGWVVNRIFYSKSLANYAQLLPKEKAYFAVRLLFGAGAADKIVDMAGRGR